MKALSIKLLAPLFWSYFKLSRIRIGLFNILAFPEQKWAWGAAVLYYYAYFYPTSLKIRSSL